MQRPPGVSYTLTDRWLAVTHAVTTALGAHLILGINLEADSGRAGAAEVSALRGGIGTSSIIAMEPGNEPELYGSWGWYCSPSGQEVTGRPPSYDFTAFVRDFSMFTRALPPGPLAGPTIGNINWFPGVPVFIASEPRLRLVTLHRYPLQNFIPPDRPKYPTVAHLLSDAASQGLAASVAPYVRIAHARHLPLRIDEMNNVSAGGAPGVANAFVSALWVVDALFQLANGGVDGVNIHTFPGAAYELFRFTHENGRWQASVSPEYYGLLMFAQAAPPGSHLIALAPPGGASIRAWATRAPDGTTRVVMINDGEKRQSVALSAPGETGAATLERLEAPSYQAVQGVTLGGQSFGSQTQTGSLDGPPSDPTVKASAGKYKLRLPAASAAMLTIPSRAAKPRVR